MSEVEPVMLPWLEAPLAQALREVRGHAVLIHGVRGVGQFELGLAVAAAWLCEAEADTRREAARACGRCAACLLIAARTHPDLMVVIPPVLQEALGWAGDDEANDGEGSKSKAKPSKDIKVEAVRATVDFAQQTSARGRAKVVVFYPAERMNATSANTLLKTLEEPPGATRFVLVTAAPQRLLPTVRSRCQALSLPLPAADLASNWLCAQGIEQPDVLLAAAGGAPLEALERLKLGIDAAVWAALPQALLAGRAAAVSGWPIPLVVDALQKLCHDLITVAVGASPRYFAAGTLPASGDLASLTTCAKELARAARHAEHPWNAGLALEALVQQLALAARPTQVAPAQRSSRLAAAALATLKR